MMTAVFPGCFTLFLSLTQVGERAASKRARVAAQLTAAARALCTAAADTRRWAGAQPPDVQRYAAMSLAALAAVTVAALVWPRPARTDMHALSVGTTASSSSSSSSASSASAAGKAAEMTLARARSAASRALPWAEAELDVRAAEALVVRLRRHRESFVDVSSGHTGLEAHCRSKYLRSPPHSHTRATPPHMSLLAPRNANILEHSQHP